MKLVRRLAAKIVLAIVGAILLGGLALTYLGKGHEFANFVFSSQNWNAAYWRAELSFRKVLGNVPELSWGELWELMSHRGGLSLETAATEGISVGAAISNPYIGPEDQEVGARLFRERCSICHGPDGIGLRGPSLNQFGYKHGDSNLALFKVLRNGIPGTAMVPPDLSFVERWQVIGYLRTLQLRSTALNEAHPIDIQVSAERIRTSDTRSGDWLTYSGSLNGSRYALQTEITPANVSQLRIRWAHQFGTNESRIESTPLVVNGVIFTTEPPANVVALDATTGGMIWKYERSLATELPACCGKVNRGLAILGDSLFFGSMDGYLVAINTNTGKVAWETRVASPSGGYSITGAPLIANNSVIVGVSGGEFAIRGFLAAYDAATGQLQWKFDTIPGPGEFGHETWSGDAWRTGGGGTWVTGSFDPTSDLLFWGVGNPSPNFSGDGRPGDNLFSDSVIALHASTGRLAWHFQFTPHDEHDWDSGQTPILADILIGGANRKVICWPNRNGFYYVLDRRTGEFLLGTPFVDQNWAKGLDSTGRPIPSDAAEVTDAGRFTKPGGLGATNWQPAAFSAPMGLIFVHATEGASVFTKTAPERIQRRKDGFVTGSGAYMTGSFVPMVRALDAATGAKRWEYRSPPPNTFDYTGLLSTAGGLVFGASGGVLFALDATTGNEMWRVPLGGDSRAPPISFTIGGRQMIAVATGRALFLFGL